MTPKKKISAMAATAPRPTRAAALLLASALSVPVYILLSLIDWLLF